MPLNSDRDGFLLPDERLSADELAQGIRGIKRNTDAILSLLRSQRRSLDRSRITNPNSTRRTPGGTPGPAPAQRQTSDRASVPVPGGSNGGGRTGSTGGGAGAGGTRERDSRGRFTRDPGAEVAGEVRQMTRQQAQQNAERQRAEESRRNREGTDDADGSGGRTRDARGRFGAGGGSDSDEDKSAYDRMKDFFKDRSSGPALDGADKVDPVIESAKEVMGMVGGAVGALKATGELGRAVIGRGFGGPKKREEGATPWFKRLLQQLKLMRRDDAQHNRAELRALNEPQAGGGGGSIITDILKLILSPIGAAIVAALAGIWMGWGKDIIGGWNSFISGVKTKWDSAVDTFMGIWEPIAKFFSDKFGLVTDTAAALGNKANEAVKSATGVDVKAGAQKLGEAASSTTSKAAASIGAAKDWAGGKISRLISTKGKDRNYQRQDGAVEQRQDGSVSWRNNNPGNLKFGYKDSADKTVKSKRSKEKALADARSRYGDELIDLDQFGNAIFSTPEAGRVAQAKLLKSSHGNKTVEEMLPKYAIDDYSGKANHAKYAAGIHKAAQEKGLDLRGKKIGDLTDPEMGALLDGMKKVEGYKVGTTSVTPAPGAAPQLAAILGDKQASTSPQAIPGWANVLNVPARAAGPLVLGAGRVPSVGMSAMQAAAIPGMGSTLPTPTMAGAMPAPGVPSSSPRITSITIPTQAPPAPAPRSDAPVPLGKKAPVEVTVRNPAPPAGQDVKDRRLAHIVTGGMSGG
jgi:hypothetical protein